MYFGSSISKKSINTNYLYSEITIRFRNDVKDVKHPSIKYLIGHHPIQKDL